VTGLCVLTMAGALVSALAGDSFTLAWSHSVEKIRWEEDYRIAGSRFVLTAARVSGSGAGMEPPPDAILKDGQWHYVPVIDPLSQLRLARAGVTADYQICQNGACQELGQLIPDPNSTQVTLIPCH